MREIHARVGSGHHAVEAMVRLAPVRVERARLADRRAELLAELVAVENRLETLEHVEDQVFRELTPVPAANR